MTFHEGFIRGTNRLDGVVEYTLVPEKHEMDDFIEGHFGYLWKESGHSWVLLKESESNNDFLVFNKISRAILLIEIEEVKLAVCEKMKAAGCEIINFENLPKSDVVFVPDELDKTRGVFVSVPRNPESSERRDSNE